MASACARSGGTSATFCCTPGAPGRRRAETVRHLPDAILIRDQHVTVTPSQPVRLVEAFGVTLNPLGVAVAILVAQQREIADPLLGNDYVTVRQHEQAARVLEAGRERRDREAFGARGVCP